MITSLLLASAVWSAGLSGNALGIKGLCVGEDAHHIVLLRQFLEGRGPDWRSHDEVVRAAVENPADPNIAKVTVTFFDPPCRVVFEETFAAESARARTGRLGGLDVVDIVTAGFGGSGSSYGHKLYIDDASGLKPIRAPNLDHTSMGGFHLGPLGDGRGEGVVVWDAIWAAEDQTHYSPHRYQFKFYRWNGSSFAKPEVVETKERFDPSPDNAAKSAGYDFRDETGQEDMPRVFVGGPG